MWLVWQKLGRHLVFYYNGTVSTFFLFESVTQEMRDLHHAPSHLSPHLSTSLSTFLKSLRSVSQVAYSVIWPVLPGWRGRRAGWNDVRPLEGFRGDCSSFAEAACVFSCLELSNVKPGNSLMSDSLDGLVDHFVHTYQSWILKFWCWFHFRSPAIKGSNLWQSPIV